MAVGAGPSPTTDSDTRTVRDARRGTHDASFIQAGLARIIEGEILPRLARVHREERPARPVIPGPPLPERAVTLARTLIDREPDDPQITLLLGDGVPLDTLLLDLLTPAARHLGWLWEEDEADFVQVTLALGRLHTLARTLCEQLETLDARPNGRRILLLPCPGETHHFSLALVASFFREAGWAVVLASACDEAPITLVQEIPFDVIGISLSCDVLLPTMAALIAGLRAASCKPDTHVLVGGPLFLRDPVHVATVGADATATDGRTAVQVARVLCDGHP